MLKSDWLSTILISVEWDSTRHANDDDDCKENVKKKSLAVISKTTISHMQYFFPYITLPFLATRT